MGVREKLTSQAPQVEMLSVEKAPGNTDDDANSSNERCKKIGRLVEGYLGRSEQWNDRHKE